VSNDCYNDTFSVNLTVFPLPVVVISNDTTLVRDDTLLLNASGGVAYEWTPDTLMMGSNFADPEVFPFNSTTYTVTVTDENGCVNTDTVRVEVLVQNLILLPDAFTPNNDGKNDLFRIIKTLNVERLVLFEIYNRWGNKVFETNDLKVGWNGDYKGEPAQSANYVYVIKAINRDGAEINQKGNVFLIR
jgi:gliding motility-associated-like protein